MGRRIIYDKHKVMFGISTTQLVQKRLEAVTIKAGQIETEALSSSRFNRGVEPTPFVLSLHGVAGPLAKTAVTLLVPVDKAEARFVEAQHLDGFVCGGVLCQELGKVFLNASCASGSAF